MKRAVLVGCLLGLGWSGCAHDEGATTEPAVSSSLNAADADQLIEQLAGRIVARIGDRPLRLAVHTGSGGTGTGEGDRQLNGYLADRLTSALMRHPDRVRLFERGRLELLLAENALGQTGVLAVDDVRAVGQLAPIDALVTLNHSVMDQHVALSCRMIDVVSGEILLAEAGVARLTPELQALLRPAGPVPPPQVAATSVKVEVELKPPAPKIDECEGRVKPIEELLTDLSTPKRIDALVEAVTEIAFDDPCGRIHQKVLSLFRRHDIQSPRYRTFLLETLGGGPPLESQAQVYDAASVVRYLAADGEVDDAEWQAGLGLLKRLGRFDHASVLLGYLLPLEGLKDRKVTRTVSRVDAYFALAHKGKLGKPVAVPFGTAFFEIFGALRPGKGDHAGPFIHCYRTYGGELDGAQQARTFDDLRYALRDVDEPDHKRQLLELICLHFERRDLDVKLGRDIFSLLRGVERGRLTQAEFDALLGGCGPRLVAAIGKIDGQEDQRTEFCLEHALGCPGLPSAHQLADQLLLEDLRQRRRAAELLVLMGPRAQPAEKQVIKVLGYLEGDRIKGSGSANLWTDCLRILGQIKTRNPQGIAALTGALGDKYAGRSKAAQQALVALGPGAVKPLVGLLHHDEERVRLSAVKTLGQLGAQAKDALPELRKMKAETADEYLRDQIELSIQAISA